MKKNKKKSRLLVDKDKWGINDNTYSIPPDYYYDIEFQCVDCGKEEVWQAKQQKIWYEDKSKTINSYAKRCQLCRAHILAKKEDQKRHMEKVANQPKNPNEKFFKN